MKTLKIIAILIVSYLLLVVVVTELTKKKPQSITPIVTAPIESIENIRAKVDRETEEMIEKIKKEQDRKTTLVRRIIEDELKTFEENKKRSLEELQEKKRIIQIEIDNKKLTREGKLAKESIQEDKKIQALIDSGSRNRGTLAKQSFGVSEKEYEKIIRMANIRKGTRTFKQTGSDGSKIETYSHHNGSFNTIITESDGTETIYETEFK